MLTARTSLRDVRLNGNLIMNGGIGFISKAIALNSQLYRIALYVVCVMLFSPCLGREMELLMKGYLRLPISSNIILL